MKIKVAARFRPYSHQPGASCLIPGQERIRQLWPSKAVIRDFNGAILEESAGAKTLFMDLEKPFKAERLSFGVHKNQDIDLIRRRKDLAEVLPIWFKLATHYQLSEEVSSGSLLYELIHETDRNLLGDLFLKTYLAGFSPFFVPRSSDIEFHGFERPPLQDENPLLLLTLGADAIKRMIVEEREGVIHVLPRLPSQFHTGRLIETPLSHGTISIEWTKHFLRQVIYTANEEGGEVNLLFPKEVKRYRVKSIGSSLYFDNFMA